MCVGDRAEDYDTLALTAAVRVSVAVSVA